MRARRAHSLPDPVDPTDVAPHDLIRTSARLSDALAGLVALGGSPFGPLYDRQNLGGIGERTTLGAPGRAEFNNVASPELPVINLATYGYVALGNDPRVKGAAISAIERYGPPPGGTRALSGTTRLHWEFEQRLAAFVRIRDQRISHLRALRSR